MLSKVDEIKHKLSELANSNQGSIEGGVIEVYWTGPNENEFPSEESVTTIAEEALSRIKELETAISQTIGWAEAGGKSRQAHFGDTLRLLKDAVGYQQPLL